MEHSLSLPQNLYILTGGNAHLSLCNNHQLPEIMPLPCLEIFIVYPYIEICIKRLDLKGPFDLYIAKHYLSTFHAKSQILYMFIYFIFTLAVL